MKFTVFSLLWNLLILPKGYRILMCADFVLPPSPWTEEFDIEVDHEHRVVRLRAKEMV